MYEIFNICAQLEMHCCYLSRTSCFLSKSYRILTAKEKLQYCICDLRVYSQTKIYVCIINAMTSITKARPKLATTNDPIVANDLEIGPIKIEQETSTDDESNEEPELETPTKKSRISEQLEPKK